MNDREYLRSLGFTVGERGRFSKEMTEALANRNQVEAEEFINEALESVGLPPQIQQRPAQELHGLTMHGVKIAFIMCSLCSEHMMWCECPNGVMAPDNVAVLTGPAKDIARLHPRMLQLTTTI